MRGTRVKGCDEKFNEVARCSLHVSEVLMETHRGGRDLDAALVPDADEISGIPGEDFQGRTAIGLDWFVLQVRSHGMEQVVDAADRWDVAPTSAIQSQHRQGPTRARLNTGVIAMTSHGRMDSIDQSPGYLPPVRLVCPTRLLTANFLLRKFFVTCVHSCRHAVVVRVLPHWTPTEGQDARGRLFHKGQFLSYEILRSNDGIEEERRAEGVGTGCDELGNRVAALFLYFWIVLVRRHGDADIVERACTCNHRLVSPTAEGQIPQRSAPLQLQLRRIGVQPHRHNNGKHAVDGVAQPCPQLRLGLDPLPLWRVPRSALCVGLLRTLEAGEVTQSAATLFLHRLGARILPHLHRPNDGVACAEFLQAKAVLQLPRKLCYDHAGHLKVQLRVVSVCCTQGTPHFPGFPTRGSADARVPSLERVEVLKASLLVTEDTLRVGIALAIPTPPRRIEFVNSQFRQYGAELDSNLRGGGTASNKGECDSATLDQTVECQRDAREHIGLPLTQQHCLVRIKILILSRCIFHLGQNTAQHTR